MHSGDTALDIPLFVYRMGTPGPVNANGQSNPDRAPFAHPAVHLNGSLHLVYQFFHDKHAEANAVIMGSCILMFLSKRFENMLFEIFPNADSRVFDYKPVAGDSVFTGGLLYLNKYATMDSVIFDGIVHDIH